MTDYYNSRFALLFAPRGEKRWAKTIGQATWYSVPEAEVSDAWRRHEDKHKAQYRRDGVLGFQARYARDYWRGRLRGLSAHEAYLATAYEVEARAAEAEA